MYQIIEQYLKQETGLGKETVQMVYDAAQVKTLRRNELLLEEGGICRHKVLIVSGLLRSYSVSDTGAEHIVQFSPELTWTLDVESYDKATPSRINIGAVEPSQVLLWEKEDFQALLREHPELKQFSERLIARNIYYTRHRMITTLSATPEEKYNDFVGHFPHLLSRVPLWMVASYLGLSLKTITRVRQGLLKAAK